MLVPLHVFAALFRASDFSCRLSSLGSSIVEYVTIFFTAPFCCSYLSSYSEHLYRERITGQFLGFMTLVPVIFSSKRIKLPFILSSLVFRFRATETVLFRASTQGSFQCYGLFACNIFAEIKTLVFGSVVISCFVSELPHRELKPGQHFLIVGFPCNFLLDTNNLRLGAYSS